MSTAAGGRGAVLRTAAVIMIAAMTPTLVNANTWSCTAYLPAPATHEEIKRRKGTKHQNNAGARGLATRSR